MRIARYLPRLICNVLIDSFQSKICCRFLKRFLLIAGFLCIHNQLPGKNNTTTLYSDFIIYNSSIFKDDQLPLVFTGEPVDITTNSAVIAGKVVAKSADIIDRGFYWGKDSAPYENGDQISMGSGYGNFYFTLEDLELNTTYYVVAYAVNDNGIAFGEIRSFITQAELPVVKTAEATDVTARDATIAGKVVYNGGADIIEQGWYLSTLPDPLGASEPIIDETGETTFSKVVTNLEPNTNYFIVAFARNIQGIGYGNIESFTTLIDTPEVITYEPDIISWNSAWVGGEVISDGGDEITDRGVLLGTDPNPVQTGLAVLMGNGTGAFADEIFDLQPNTTYYVVAYASNIELTGYGEIKSFQTPATLPGIITLDPIEIHTSTAILGGEVFSDGGLFVFERGIIWSADSMAILDGIEISSGSDIGYFEAYVSDLQPGREYFYTAWAENGLGRSYGEVIAFTTEPILTLKFMPNAFMPDSHLYENREFKPLFYVVPDTYSLKIFNRWGSEVFATKMADQGWDGRINNRDAPQGSYTYRLQYVDELGREHEMSGTLMLIR